MAGSAWFFMSLTAAIFWGASYALSERVLKDYNISASFILLSQGIIYVAFFLGITLTQDSFKPNITTLAENKTALISLVAMLALSLAGSYLVLSSISLKNASLSNLIEISYPVFTILFAWVLTREVQVNMPMMIGGLLIFSGVTLIYLKS